MKVKGRTRGLSASVMRLLERLSQRNAGVREFVTPSFASALLQAATAAGRRIGVLVDRRGAVLEVLVGDAETLEVPQDFRRRYGPTRLSGVRLIHGRPKEGNLTKEDLITMRLLSLDATVLITPPPSGHVPLVEVGLPLPSNSEGNLWEVLPKTYVTALEGRFDLLVRDVEDQMARDSNTLRTEGSRDAAIIVLPVIIDKGSKGFDIEREIEELKALCRTASVAVADVVVQKMARESVNPRTLIGLGKLKQITMLGLQKGVDLLIFGAPLTPSQQRNVAKETGVRVIDRNQLILDIFAKHARTIEGRLQVELAQMRYNLPRLSEKDDSMSRLTGGIGALGPGETKLEMERRRAKDRIHLLEERLKAVSAERANRRRLRMERGVPVVALVGYTNAGKSTLFNAITGANVRAEDMLFATLDPTTRKVRHPERRDFLLTDTVGFIRDLPKELVGAFKATLEEVETATALVIVADASDPHLDLQINSVRTILRDLGLSTKPSILVLNKIDLLPDEGTILDLVNAYGGIPVCAKDPKTLGPLLLAIDEMLGRCQRDASEREEGPSIFLPGDGSP